MSQEITLNLALTVAKAGASAGANLSLLQDMAGANFIGNVQAVTTAASQIDLGSIAVEPAYLLVVNLDSANFVTIDGANTFDRFPQKIRPGCCILLAPTNTTVWAKADTAPLNINVVACDL